MHSVVAVFPTWEAAERAAKTLKLPDDRVSVVAPGPREQEDSGIGPTLGGAVGAAVGAAAGSSLGTAVASLLLPGVGPVVATGIVAAFLFGAGGAAIGAAAGSNVESATDPEPAHDPRDVFFFHEALRRGRAVLMALAETREQADLVRSTLAAAGGESLDTTREAWWRDLRDDQGDFAGDEDEYRRGFEAALADPGKHPADSATAAYRQGYERGCEYLRKLS